MADLRLLHCYFVETVVIRALLFGIRQGTLEPHFVLESVGKQVALGDCVPDQPADGRLDILKLEVT